MTSGSPRAGDREVEDLSALLPQLLHALESLAFIARGFTPGRLSGLLTAVGDADAELKGLLAPLAGWPAGLSDVRDSLTVAVEEASAGYSELRAAARTGDLGQAYRAMRHAPRADEALYPLAAGLPPVSRYFLPPEARNDAALVARLAAAPTRGDTGLFHIDAARAERGGVSLYVPETYDPARPVPVICALHGGSGHGRAFLWSWLRHARARGAILISPTSVGATWALSGPDLDSPRLAHWLEQVRARWAVDSQRLLLTGMSDGGTFAYVSGLEADSPFTHLAPIAAAFHPMLAQFANPERIRGLPIHIVHGGLDWMFPITMAEAARDALASAGAAVQFTAIPDLGHTYPGEMNGPILDGLAAES